MVGAYWLRLSASSQEFTRAKCASTKSNAISGYLDPTLATMSGLVVTAGFAAQCQIKSALGELPVLRGAEKRVEFLFGERGLFPFRKRMKVLPFVRAGVVAPRSL